MEFILEQEKLSSVRKGQTLGEGTKDIQPPDKHADSKPKSYEDYLKLWQVEFDGYYEEMYKFRNLPSEEIFIKLSAWTSRASYIRSVTVRNYNHKKLQWFRTQEIDPFLTECDRQFRNWSRKFSVDTIDWNAQRGQI